MPRLSVALIGLGQQAINDHMPALLRRTDVRIVGGCDPDVAAQKNFRQAFPEIGYGIPLYKTVDELLDSSHPRLVIVAVPHDSYLDIVRTLCERHIYFLKEKPLARNAEEAKVILSVPNFDQYGFVAAQRRYNPLYQKAKETLADIGHPYLFNAVYKLNVESPHSGWRGNKNSAGGGCLIDMSYHIVDQLVWWFGMPEKLNAQISNLAVSDGHYDTEDTATVSFRYANGLHGTLVASRAAGEKTEHYELYGSNGYIEGSKKELAIHDRQGHLMSQVSLSDCAIMTDAQLDFFISRVMANQGFGDVQEQHLQNMHFIERCYKDAAMTTGKTANV